MTPTTTIEAVNIMLASIGEAPVNSLASGLVDAALAQNILSAVSRDVQSKGWSFNTDKKVKLSPTAGGEIILPANTLKADISVATNQLDLVQRGNRMYNRATHTFVIGTSVELDLVSMLDFESLPETARRFITLKSARTFQDQTVGSRELHGFQERDEMSAWIELQESESDTADYTIFDSQDTYAIINRNRY